MSNTVLFPKRLKKLREMKKLNQSELAEKLNVTNGAVSKWERGERQPDFYTLTLIARFFDVSCDYLVGNDTYNYIPDNFNSPQEALSFILKQEMVANFGGYDLDAMSDEEIMDMANDIADMLRIVSRKHKK